MIPALEQDDECPRPDTAHTDDLARDIDDLEAFQQTTPIVLQGGSDSDGGSSNRTFAFEFADGKAIGGSKDVSATQGDHLTVAADSVVVNTSVIATVASVNTGLAGKAGKYAAALTGGGSPEAGWELLSTEERYEERVLLGVRLAEGLPLSVLSPAGRLDAPALAAG